MNLLGQGWPWTLFSVRKTSVQCSVFRLVFRSERRLNTPGEHFFTSPKRAAAPKAPPPFLDLWRRARPKRSDGRADLNTGKNHRTLITCLSNTERVFRANPGRNNLPVVRLTGGLSRSGERINALYLGFDWPGEIFNFQILWHFYFDCLILQLFHYVIYDLTFLYKNRIILS